MSAIFFASCDTATTASSATGTSTTGSAQSGGGSGSGSSQQGGGGSGSGSGSTPTPPPATPTEFKSLSLQGVSGNTITLDVSAGQKTYTIVSDPAYSSGGVTYSAVISHEALTAEATGNSFGNVNQTNLTISPWSGKTTVKITAKKSGYTDKEAIYTVNTTYNDMNGTWKLSTEDENKVKTLVQQTNSYAPYSLKFNSDNTATIDLFVIPSGGSVQSLNRSDCTWYTNGQRIGIKVGSDNMIFYNYTKTTDGIQITLGEGQSITFKKQS